MTAKRNISVTFVPQLEQLLGPSGSIFEVQMETINLSIKLPVNRDTQNDRFHFPDQQRHPKFDRDPPTVSYSNFIGFCPLGLIFGQNARYLCPSKHSKKILKIFIFEFFRKEKREKSLGNITPYHVNL